MREPYIHNVCPVAIIAQHQASHTETVVMNADELNTVN